MIVCPSCATPVPDGSRFCPNCGQGLVERSDERRVATVVFADLVGFTTLAESRDPEQVKNLVDGCFERLVAEVNSFGGRVDKIIGDAIVALFGAPVAHEDDAERAVRAALRMQQVLGEHAAGLDVDIRMRVGVNTGEVLVGALKAGGDYTAMGDAVNVAQRLQAAARPGEVLVGPATHAATVNVIVYDSFGLVAARNREEPIDAWVAREVSTPPGRRPHRVRVPFVGRDDEVAVAGASIRLAVVHGRAQLLLVMGEAGVGKSRLCEEIALRSEADHDALVLEGRCVPYGESNPWFPMAEAIRLGLGLTLSGEDDRAALVRAVGGLLERDHDDPEVGRTADGLLHLMALPGPLQSIDPGRAREEVTRAVLSVLQTWARRQPLLLSLADLQWAEDQLIELIGFALQRLASLPFVLLVTSRKVSETFSIFGSGRHSTVVLQLDPLDRRASAQLLDTMLGDQLGDRDRAQLLDRSGGNPLFLEELVALVEADSDRVELPDTLRGLVLARLDRLAPPERAMLDNAAVLGSSGSVASLEEFGVALGQETSSAILNRLMGLDLLEVVGDRWAFRSESVREVAYTTLTKAARARRHLGIARAMQRMDKGPGVELIAGHLASAVELATDVGTVRGVPATVAAEAVELLCQSADRAMESDSPLTASRLARRALGLLSADDPRRATVQLREARALAELHRIAEARVIIDELVSAELDETVAASARTVLASIEQAAGNLGASVAAGDAAITSWRALDDERGLAEALRIRGLTGIMLFDAAGAEVFLQEARALSLQVGDRRGVAWADQHLAWLSFLQGDIDLADRRIEAAAATFDELGDQGGRGWALGLSAWVRFQQGRFEQAEELAVQIRHEGEARGDRWGQAMMMLLLANLELWRGRSSAAGVLAEEAHAVFRSIGDRHGQGLAFAPMIRAEVARGHVAEVNRLLEESWAVGDQTSTRVMATTIAAGAAVHLGLGQQSGAELEAAMPRGLATHESLASVGLLALQFGDPDRALAVLTEAADLFPGVHPYLTSALALARCATGDMAGAAEAAEAVLNAAGVTYLDAITATVAAASARARGEDVEGALSLLASARISADATDDRVAQLVVRLAELEIRDIAGMPADELRWLVSERLGDLGADLVGWRRAIRLALGVSLAGVQ